MTPTIDPPLRRLLFLLPLALFLCTCGSAEKTTEPGQEEKVSEPGGAPKYASLPLDRLQHIFSNSTYMDATFYDLPISINQSETAQIQQTIAGIGKDPMAHSPACKPIGHIWFQIDGRNIEEADIYFQNECVGYVWYDKGQPAFSNALTEKGANFYLNILAQVKDQPGQ